MHNIYLYTINRWFSENRVAIFCNGIVMVLVLTRLT